jgi:hypothetical protein
MNGWSIYWVVWAGAVFVSFAAPEFWALATGHSENTLSQNLWRLEQFLPGQHVWQWSALHFLIGGALLVLLVWLIGHLVFGIWR